MESNHGGDVRIGENPLESAQGAEEIYFRSAHIATGSATAVAAREGETRVMEMLERWELEDVNLE